MIKKATSILLIIVTSVALFHCSIPYLWYITNYEYIVTELCINRDNPEVHCNGHCQLEKMIHNRHQNEQKPVLPSSQKQAIDLIIVDMDDSLIEPAYASVSLSHYLDHIETLWFYSPSTPPPQIS